MQSLSLSETNNEPTSSTETSAKIDKLLSLVSGDNGENEVHKSKLDDSWSCFETVSKKEEGNKIESTFSEKTKDNWASFDWKKTTTNFQVFGYNCEFTLFGNYKFRIDLST